MPEHKNITVFESPDTLAAGAADFIMERAKAAIRASGRFTIALSGGSTPEKLFKILAKPPYNEAMPWDRIFVFWGDERCVALDDNQNNAHKALELLFNKVDIPAGNIHRIPSNHEPEDAAAMYEITVKQFFEDSLPSFDLILLGMGENGHTASLFPHTVVLHETTNLVAAIYVEEVSMYRITMTALLINNAQGILFLLAGPGKAAMLHTILNGNSDPDQYPAQMINPQSGGLYWYIDKAAAALL